MPGLIYRLQLFVFITVFAVTPTSAQNIPDGSQTNDLPNPNPTVIQGWAELAHGRAWRSSASVDIGPDGHIWTYDRCSASTLPHSCNNSTVDPILKFHSETGTVITSFGAGEFVLPDGIHVDSDGNVWITDSMGNVINETYNQLKVSKIFPYNDVIDTIVKFAPKKKNIVKNYYQLKEQAILYAKQLPPVDSIKMSGYYIDEITLNNCS